MAAPAWRSPIRERRPGQPRPTLALAFGAEKGRAPTLDDSFHRAPAGAGLALAIIDGEILGEIAEVAVGRRARGEPPAAIASSSTEGIAWANASSFARDTFPAGLRGSMLARNSASQA